jgi:hypothetical protein
MPMQPKGGICTTTRAANAAQRKSSSGTVDNRDQVDLPREIPETRSGHEHFGGKDCNILFGSVAARRARGLKIALAADIDPISAMSMADGNAKFKR